MLDQIKQTFNKKDIINFLLLGIAALAIPITVGTLNQQRIIKSKATNPPVQIVANSSDPEADTFQPVNNKLVLSDTNGDNKYKVYVQLEPVASLLTANKFPSLVKTAWAIDCTPGQATRECKNNLGTGHHYCEWFEDGNTETDCIIEACWAGGTPGGATGGPNDGSGCNISPACWNNGGWVNTDSANNGCTTNHGSGSTCSQSVPGPYGDGCTQNNNPLTTAPPANCANITKGDGTANSRCHSGNDCNTGAGLTCQGPDDDCGWGRCKSTGSDTTRPSQCKSGDSCTVCGSDGACLGVEKCKGPDIGGYGRCVKPPADTTPTQVPAQSPTQAPAPPQQPVIEKFKLAQSIAGLAQATEQTFTGVGQLVPFIFQNPNIGAENFIFVQFIGKDAQGRVTTTRANDPNMRAAITISGPGPVITGSACNIDVDLKDGSLKFTALGSNFGARDRTKSKLMADSSELEIKEWSDQKVVAKMANPPDTSTGKTYTITLTRADNASATATCDVNTPQVSLEAKVFCRQPTNFEQDNVDMSVFEMVGVGTSIPGSRLSIASSSRETVRIGRNKVINNIRAKIKQGATYVVCLLAPKSVRACTDPFQAVADGNNKLANFTLPVGDLNSDCKINNVDASLLKRQWGPVNAGKNCDMNNDGKCNTFEWSCLLHDFNSSCAQEPR